MTRRPAPVESWNPPYCGDIGLKIRRDGTWLYRDSPIGRPALVKLFAGVLRKDEDGRTYLVTPAEKVDVEVEDAPFLAVEMEARGAERAQQLAFRTNVDDVVACGPDNPLRFAEQEPGRGLKPYVLVRGRLEALLTRALRARPRRARRGRAARWSAPRRRLERRRLLSDRRRRGGQCTLNSAPTRRTSAGVSSLLWATVTLNSLPSSFAVQKSRKLFSLGKRG